MCNHPIVALILEEVWLMIVLSVRIVIKVSVIVITTIRLSLVCLWAPVASVIM